MFERIIADFVVIIHLLFIVFVVAGGMLAIKHNWVMWLHIPAFVWGVLISFFGWTCPLTPIENEFRARAGTGGYDGGFIEHYILGIIYPERLLGDLPPTIFMAIGFLVLLINIYVYWKLFKK